MSAKKGKRNKLSPLSFNGKENHIIRTAKYNTEVNSNAKAESCVKPKTVNEEIVENPTAGPSTQEIYNTRALGKKDTTYKLEKFEKNLLLIFNQENVKDYKPRLGPEKDVQALKDTFSNFGFEINEYKDLTRKEIFKKLEIFEEKDFTNYGCVAVAVLTHGTKHGLIRAKDTKYKESKIIKYFKTHDKPTLITKPKILIIQAYRGYKMMFRNSGVIRTDTDENLEPYTLPVESDMLILHSSYTANPPYWDDRKGSWFIQTLCQKINKCAAKLDLESIITEVKREVDIGPTGETDIDLQMLVHTSTLIRKLYLRKPGDEPIYSDDESELFRSYSLTDSEPSTPMTDSGQCPCFLKHYLYIMDCLRYNVSLEGCKYQPKPRLTYYDQIDHILSEGGVKRLQPACLYEESSECEESETSLQECLPRKGRGVKICIYFIEANPNDKKAQSYLKISNTYQDGVEFNAPKEQLAKAICTYFSTCPENVPHYEYIYMYKNGLYY